MAEQNQARILSAAFPTPPPFHKYFTKQNISKLRQARKEAVAQGESSRDEISNSDDDLSTLQSELRHLIPPEPPADGRYKSFGIQHDLSQPEQSLSAAGIQQLYPAPPSPTSSTPTQPDPTPHLLTLTRAILLNFLELVGLLSTNPEDYADKIDHLQTLFYNVHDLINQYRPHQARETLILMMEEQLDRIQAQVGSVTEGRIKVDLLLKTLQEQPHSAPTELIPPQERGTFTHIGNASKMDRKSAQIGAWAALQQEMG